MVVYYPIVTADNLSSFAILPIAFVNGFFVRDFF